MIKTTLSVYVKIDIITDKPQNSMINTINISHTMIKYGYSRMAFNLVMHEAKFLPSGGSTERLGPWRYLLITENENKI